MNIKKKAEANSSTTWLQIKTGDFQNCPLTTASVEVKPYKVKVTDEGVTMYFFRALRLKEGREKLGKIDMDKVQEIVRPFGMFLDWGKKGEPDELFIERHPSDLKEAIREFKKGLDAIWDVEWRLNKDSLNQDKE